MSTSPLPEGWVSKESKSRPGVTYYFNTTNRETTWSKPTQAATAHVKKKRKKERGNDEGEKVQVLHLLKKNLKSRKLLSRRTGKEVTATQEEAIDVLRKLRDEIEGAANREDTFRTLAKAESDCGSFQTSGEMKSFGRGKMQKPFEETSFALAVGELSDIVTTDSGVHIIYRMK